MTHRERRVEPAAAVQVKQYVRRPRCGRQRFEAAWVRWNVVPGAFVALIGAVLKGLKVEAPLNATSSKI